MSKDGGESSLFKFAVDPGINGRNSTYDIIPGNWAEVLQFEMLEVLVSLRYPCKIFLKKYF